MKKILFGLISILFMCTVSAAEVKFEYPNSVKAGEKFTVKMIIENASNLKYVRATNYRYDSDKITINDYDSLSGFVGTGSGNNPMTSIGGNIGFEMTNTTAKNGNVEVLYLTYTASSSLVKGDVFNIRMDQVFVGSNTDGSNAQNISSEEHCIAISVSDSSTPTVTPNPPTGVNTTLAIVITTVLLVAGCAIVFKKNKMYY